MPYTKLKEKLSDQNLKFKSLMENVQKKLLKIQKSRQVLFYGSNNSVGRVDLTSKMLYKNKTTQLDKLKEVAKKISKEITDKDILKILEKQSNNKFVIEQSENNEKFDIVLEHNRNLVVESLEMLDNLLFSLGEDYTLIYETADIHYRLLSKYLPDELLRM